MDKVLKNLSTEIHMKVNIKEVNLMVMAFISGKMEMNIRETSRRDIDMAMDNGKTIRKMKNMKENTSGIKKMELEFSNGVMEITMKGNLKMI